MVMWVAGSQAFSNDFVRISARKFKLGYEERGVHTNFRKNFEIYYYS